MLAKNKMTKEIIRSLDSFNNNDLYYQLDKRIWEFIEEDSKPNDIGRIKLTTFQGPYKFTETHKIRVLNDLTNIHITTSGHFRRS